MTCIDPIADAWWSGIGKLDSLYHNVVRGVIAGGDPNKVRASVIRLLRTVKEEEVTSPTRDRLLNGPDESSVSLLGIVAAGDEEEEEGIQGLLSMGGMAGLSAHLNGNGNGNGYSSKGLFEEPIVDNNYDAQGNHLMANLDLETEYQLDDYVPLYTMDWSMFQLIGGEGALSSLWTG